MKQFFLAAGILSLSSAFGQQDILDIQKYLEQKKIDDKNSIITPYYGSPRTAPTERPLNLVTLPNGNKVYTLPQDNMPCITTDLNVFNMPNPAYQQYELAALLPGNRPGKMPNAAQDPVIRLIK